MFVFSRNSLWFYKNSRKIQLRNTHYRIISNIFFPLPTQVNQPHVTLNPLTILSQSFFYYQGITQKTNKQKTKSLTILNISWKHSESRPTLQTPTMKLTKHSKSFADGQKHLFQNEGGLLRRCSDYTTSDQRCSTPATGHRGRSSRYLTRHQPGKGRGSWTNGTQCQINGLLGKGPVRDIIKISCGRSPNCNTNKETLTCRHMIWIGPLRLTAAEEKLKSSSCWQILPSEVQCPIYQTEFHTFVDKNFRLFLIFK